MGDVGEINVRMGLPLLGKKVLQYRAIARLDLDRLRHFHASLSTRRLT
jgi:hypothetical protein